MILALQTIDGYAKAHQVSRRTVYNRIASDSVVYARSPNGKHTYLVVKPSEVAAPTETTARLPEPAESAVVPPEGRVAADHRYYARPIA